MMKNNLLTSIDKALSVIAQGFIKFYQYTLSPDKSLLFRHLFSGTVCCHHPHCSEFGLMAFRRFGFVRGFHYTMERVSSCTGSDSVSYDPPFLRVVFFSGSPIGVPFLESIFADNRYELVGVVTQPAVASGRGMKLKENIIASTTERYNSQNNTTVPVFTPPSLRTDSKKRAEQAITFDKQLRDLRPDVMIVVAYGKILPQATVDIPHFGTINVHGSLLPKFRGASPLQSVFLSDHDAAGVTIMKMNAGLDEGAILSLLPIPLEFDRTVLDLVDAMKRQAPQHCLKTVWSFAKGFIDPIEQNEHEVTHCTKILKEDGLCNFYKDTLKSIYTRYQAFAMRPKIYGEIFGKKVIIESLSLHKEIYDKFSDEPLLSLLNGATSLHPAVKSIQVKPEGKKSLGWDEFVRGYYKKQ